MKPFMGYGSLLLAALTIVAFCPTQGRASNLKIDVVSALQRNFLQPFQVSVKSPGNVEIRGTVPSYTDKLEIYKDVAQVPGVKEISDRVEVQHPTIIPDDEIKANITTILAIDKQLSHPEKIHVAVDNGTVILNGSVNTPQEVASVQALVGWTPGVRSIANRLQAL